MTQTVIDLGNGRQIAAHEAIPRLNLVYDTGSGLFHTMDSINGMVKTLGYYWNTTNLDFEYTSGTSAGGGGGSATTDELTELDVASSTVTYVGNAAIGSLTSASVWKIKRLTSTVGGNLSIKYAAGVATYSQVWDNRASLSYS